jgi:hypothetical protein
VSKLPSKSLASWAAYLGIVLGLLLLVHGVQTIVSDVPRPLPYSVAILIIGVLEICLSLLMLFGRRAAWSFMVSLNGTLCVVGLFGGPKIRDTFDIALYLALLPCFLFGLVCVWAAVAHDDFE